MLVLVNSTCHQAGVSTVTYAIGYTYSNWVNRPVLIVSTGNDTFYKDKCGLKKDFNAKSLSIVNGNSRGLGELQAYCYKMNELLYYYKAHSTAANELQHLTDLRIFLERASRFFGLVVVDMDMGVNSFKHFLDMADVCFCVLPPDYTVIDQASEGIQQILNNYKEDAGLDARSDIRFIINKYENDTPRSTLGKKLGVGRAEILTIPYSKRIRSEGNRGLLTEMLNTTLINPRDITDKILEVSLKRVYESLRKG